ncbi:MULTISPECIES: 3-phosphoshikimate 1-carboxyvinyltransferase [Legionella]|uniref:3-phosphoshikimate 1-carboxyvinyltransferase n=1 Tax=Legionella septentrionalis TaxID=2498109 RepID=A0A433JKT8_9GAMM|nr:MULTISPECIES: 3-phosphoshikimate 1-carboxyvinyltransferase [Legionella]MCP0913519.1 3-phosphoshikimate 1-carboxyvinyltransferase [Legionella sp. 27cVA30]RUQ89707.1 3-phosphoshikimate 1-carboxyvinyltransferase [Legionella septentrionalis]RUQ99748.1 3-phosphoshikimate 1-carboxyvinyltransferase [Legionella septentrionalis]RUR11058.1 3-phosphoshikimate 1-carboxyvinyltransferase [Legionella septentrionalis]RUR15220.1 3-phosphoshikimate 1-carboxyvinyltransferase [Legionella septentrionalis]
MNGYHFISHPVSSLKGDITIPGDKSISHRAIMLGAIAKGITTISGFLESGDCLATLRAFQAMGVRIEGPVSQRVVIHGVGKYGLRKPAAVIDCGNSGTTMRLLAGILAAQPFDSELTGDESLLKRPMERIARPLIKMGAVINTTSGRPPISIQGGQTLQGINYEMPEASAQVKSCLLLAGMYAQGETQVIEPGLTRDHTERMLTAFSYPIQKQDNAIIINSASECQGTDVMVPGDISSAAFFIVAATLIPGAELFIRNVGINPTRTGIMQILQLMGADISLSNKRLCGEELVADLYVRHAPLEGIDIPAAMVPIAIDEFPVIFIAAACAKGQTLLHGARELRCKESDRIAAMANGLQQLGIEAQPLEDGIFIKGGHLQGGEVDSCHDHRIAMAFAIAGAIANAPVKILNCANVATSFPTFVSIANKTNMQIEETTI